MLEMQHLDGMERCRYAANRSVQDVLEYTRRVVLNNADPPEELMKLYKEVRSLASSGSDGEAPQEAADAGTRVTCIHDVLLPDASREQLAGELFAQLVRVIAEEMGCGVSHVDLLLQELDSDFGSVTRLDCRL
jgi:hypothetical protein